MIRFMGRPARRLVIDTPNGVELFKPLQLRKLLGRGRALQLARWAGADAVFCRPLERTQPLTVAEALQVRARELQKTRGGHPVSQRLVSCKSCGQVLRLLVPVVGRRHGGRTSTCARCAFKGCWSGTAASSEQPRAPAIPHPQP